MAVLPKAFIFVEVLTCVAKVLCSKPRGGGRGGALGTIGSTQWGEQKQTKTKQKQFAGNGSDQKLLTKLLVGLDSCE